MIKITQGILKKTNETFDIRLLTINNLDEIMNLQNEVYDNLIDKSKLERLSEKEFKFILSDNGLMIGVYVDNKLIAIRALLVPKNDSNHLGVIIGLEEAYLDKVIYQEISFVHPNYQGNGLQKLMAKEIMNELDKTKHSYLYVCATVDPENIPSLKDKFDQEMEVRALVTIYGEKQRYIFSKKIINEKSKREKLNEINIALSDIDNIRKHLDLNWVGKNLITKNDEIYIKLVKYKKD